MHSRVTSKNAKWCHLIWPTLYIGTVQDTDVVTMNNYSHTPLL